MSGDEQKLYNELCRRDSIEMSEEILYRIFQFYNAAKATDYKNWTDEQIAHRIFEIILKAKQDKYDKTTRS